MTDKDMLPDTPDIAAVVVIYNPDDDVYGNIMSYVEQVDLTIVVDNSDVPATKLTDALSSNEKIICLVNGQNFGIAAALNMGAREALSRGYSLLLTMDQDSRASQEMVDVLRFFFFDESERPLGVVSPFHLTAIDTLPVSSNLKFEEVDTVWTSGNLLNLSAFKAVGPFDEELFIDFVDHEYCLRLKRHGYRILQSYCAVLHHTIGTNLSKRYMLGFPFIISHHSPLRRYYITRNRFLVRKMYAEFTEFCRVDKRRFWAELVTFLLFEKLKVEKLKMVFRGYLDYRLGRLGKFGSESSRRISVE